LSHKENEKYEFKKKKNVKIKIKKQATIKWGILK
jgi:hypothetical protein